MVCVCVVEGELNTRQKPEQEWSPELEYQLQHQARLSFWVCAILQDPEITRNNTMFEPVQNENNIAFQ